MVDVPVVLVVMQSEAANIENIVLSLKIPIKLVINNLRCEESLMYLQSEVDKEMLKRERGRERAMRICILHGESQSVCT